MRNSIKPQNSSLPTQNSEEPKKIYHIFGEDDILMILEAENKSLLIKLLNCVKDIGSVNSIKTMLIAPNDGYSMSTCDIRRGASAAG